MKQNPLFLLRQIADVPYLLPYGQMIADHKRGFRINETGVYLWNLLSREYSMEELLATAAEHYEIPAEELPAFYDEIKAFLQQLISYGLIIEEFTFHSIDTEKHYLQIGGLSLCFQGPDAAFPQELQPFSTEPVTTVRQTIFMQPSMPSIHHNGTLLLRNRELVVMEQDSFYILLFPPFSRIHELHLSKDGSRAICYHVPDYCQEFRTDLFHALRFAYLYKALQEGMVALHSASFLYRDRLWLFSGPSGTGKSTHTNLWKELYDITLINGDLNLIDTSASPITVPGIPWCGTSGISDRNRYPLGGIVLLKQAPEDSIEELTPNRRELLVSQRLISPSWTAEMFDMQLNAVQAIAQQVPICMLHCTKEPSAAECMKAWIDTRTI